LFLTGRNDPGLPDTDGCIEPVILKKQEKKKRELQKREKAAWIGRGHLPELA
jgi:hypothetical protein